jgi:DnaJ-domain-containing protein 1
MFADTLDATQKEILVHVLCEIAQADQFVSVSEREVIVRYALSLGLSTDQVEQAIAQAQGIPDATLQVLPEPVRRVILIEAQTLAMIDGTYAETERIKIGDLAERLKLKPEVIQSIDSYVQRGFEWALEGSRLIEVG